MMFFQRHLIADDLLADRLANNINYHYQLQDLEMRIKALEEKILAINEAASLVEAAK
jgi:hypothetical protein